MTDPMGSVAGPPVSSAGDVRGAAGGRRLTAAAATAAVGAALAVLFTPLLLELARLWRHDPYAGHGMFVPIYSAFLLWSDRDRLRALPRRREAAGLLVVLLGLIVLAVGHRAGSVLLQTAALVGSAAGLLLWAAGARVLRAAAFPIVFLLLMVPLPRLVVNAVTLDIQRFDAAFAGAVLALAGVPSHVEGINIHLAATTLAVVEGCNGLRFLMALLTLTAAFAQVSQRTLSRKLVLTAAAVPVALLANAFRITVLALVAHYIDPSAAEGITHHSIGKGVWAAALVPLVGLALLLRRRGGSPGGRAA